MVAGLEWRQECFGIAAQQAARAKQAGYYAQPPQETPKAESYQDVADTCRASVEAGLVPAELFQMFTRKPEDVEGSTER